MSYHSLVVLPILFTSIRKNQTKFSPGFHKIFLSSNFFPTFFGRNGGWFSPLPYSVSYYAVYLYLIFQFTTSSD